MLFQVKHRRVNITPEHLHRDREVRIIIHHRADRIPHTDIHIHLLQYLASDSLLRRFPSLNLPTGKLPLISSIVKLRFPTLHTQNLIIMANSSRHHVIVFHNRVRGKSYLTDAKVQKKNCYSKK